MEERSHSSLVHPALSGANRRYHLEKASSLLQEEIDERSVSVRAIFLVFHQRFLTE